MDDADWSKYRVLRNTVTDAMRSAKLTYFEKVLDEDKNGKTMWKQIARVIGRVKQWITEVKKGSDTLTDPKSMVEAFNSHFLTIIGMVRNQSCMSVDQIPNVDSVFHFEEILGRVRAEDAEWA